MASLDNASDRGLGQLQEKRYRSMQEHIRRAHPEHYISKLPATEDSFLLMINTPPQDRPQLQPSSTSAPQGSSRLNPPCAPQQTIECRQGYPRDRHIYQRDGSSAPGTPRHLDEYVGGSLLPAASAAAALASLHGHRIEQDWDSEGVTNTPQSTTRFLGGRRPMLTQECLPGLALRHRRPTTASNLDRAPAHPPRQ